MFLEGSTYLEGLCCVDIHTRLLRETFLLQLLQRAQGFLLPCLVPLPFLQFQGREQRGQLVMLGSAANPHLSVPTGRNPLGWAQNQQDGGIPLGKAHQLWPEWPLGTEIQQCWGRGQVTGQGVKVCSKQDLHVVEEPCQQDTGADSTGT